jgi:hypothetical protein
MKIIKILIAIWLVIAPWVLGFSDQAGATWSSAISGIALLVLIFASGGVNYPTKEKPE